MSDLPVPFAHLNARISSLEWASDAANGELKGLDWVDGNIDPTLEGFVFENTENGKKYRHRTLSYFLPTIMSRMAHQSQKNGDPTVIEALTYIYANIEWLMATRKFFWSPFSPVSELLVLLAEVYGVGREIHHNDPQALSRLIARLPAWHKHSGTAAKAKELLVDIVGREVPIRAVQSASEKELSQEVLVSHEWQWWKHRRAKTSKSKMRINSGFLCFQSEKKEEQYELVREDVLITWKEGIGFPKDFLRLLPIWASVRIIIEMDNSTETIS
jgi:hypothetical protein